MQHFITHARGRRYVGRMITGICNRVSVCFWLCVYTLKKQESCAPVVTEFAPLELRYLRGSK